MKKQPSQLQRELERIWGKYVNNNILASWQHFYKHAVSRWQNLKSSKLMVGLWLGLIIVIVIGIGVQATSLRGAFLTTVPKSGGLWRDGMVGKVGNLNPLFASTNIDSAVDKLVFSSLLKYNDDQELVGDLAKSVDTSGDGLTRTVHLRDNIKWHDGKSLTSKDVVYTIKAIQDPRTGTALTSGWQGIKVDAPDAKTVVITLPAPFAPFDNYLTVPILPAHILQSIPDNQLRTADFNTAPIGSGPFTFHNTTSVGDRYEINLTRNDDYYRSPARLKSISIVGYNDANDLVKALKGRYLTAAALDQADSVPSFGQISADNHQVALDKISFAFLNNTNPILQSKKVRIALGLATDQSRLLTDNIDGTPIRAPLLPEQIGYSTGDGLKTDVKEAKSILDKAGWKVGPDGIRIRKKQRLSLKVATVSDGNYAQIAKNLQEQWHQIGVELKVQSYDSEQFQQTVLSPRNYDVLVYAISIGQDPDEYVYWHSSQIGANGLNLSNYKSSYVDNLLDGGRTRLDPVLRAKKYQAFEQQFTQDVPAIPLYRLTYNYTMLAPATGVNIAPQGDASDRYNNVTEWTQSTRQVSQTP